MRNWVGGAGFLMVTLFTAATAVASQTDKNLWYLQVLWIGTFVAVGLFLLLGLVWLVLLFKRYRNPVTIRDDWRCEYWPIQGQLKVTAWFDDYSLAPTFYTQCVARFGLDTVSVPVQMIGGTYLTRTGMPGPGSPIMLEFQAENVKVSDQTKANISIKMKPGRGIWAWVERTKEVVIQQRGV